MAETLLYGGLIVLLCAVVFAVLRPVFAQISREGSSKVESDITMPDFRPRDGSGRISKKLPTERISVNRPHPSHKYREDIAVKLQTHGGAFSKLDLPEQNFWLAYCFDDHLQAEGLSKFLKAFPSIDMWTQTRDALYIVRADEYYSVFSTFLECDGPEAAKALDEGRLSEFKYSTDWDAQLLGSTTDSTETGKSGYMERRLDFYCDDGDGNE
ncbi:hypothetical protein QWY75_05375 [Pontixanthobacter aestiaquae]|uniref:Uncharacterized protein n=1 Tax=Pontixanthobacter aestiaquae TaxID=1509367 RepID=A0A844Z8H0_9SPHN|nr:hypothetical protein [Pontixanthobacter aestiaquae]MDN3645636.1 hypothetical protein [Pontixanthobacter aestiaquae]MXO83367.1 hypothetical protein [Pontixanthobacter aestiaquae]